MGIPLYIAVNEIPEKVELILREAMAEGGLLEEVKEIVRWNSARREPEPPCIWIFPQDSVPTTGTLTNRSYWEMTFVMAAVYKANEPSVGFYKATELAAKTRDVLIKSRKLGLDYVTDIVDLPFSSSNNSNSSGVKYGAVATIKVKFTTD